MSPANQVHVKLHGVQAADQIYEVLERGDLKEARRMFLKRYKQPYDDKAIDAELEDCFKTWLDLPAIDVISDTVTVPGRLLLALILREGFAGRGKGNLGKAPARLFVEERARTEFRKLRDELKLELKGVPNAALTATDRAAEAISKKWDVPVKALLAGPKKRRKNRPNRDLRP